MPYPDFTVAEIMNTSAALNNDAALTQYTYLFQLPYFKLALQELQEAFEQNSIPITNEASISIPVPIGTTEIGFVGITAAPNLPNDLVEIQRLWYSPTGQEQWIPMTKRDFLPHYLESVQIGSLSYYTWEGQKIKILPATSPNDIKLDYVRTLFPNHGLIDQNTNIAVINAKTFLEYRTGALCAQFIGENKTRADELNGFALMGIDRALGIGTKGRQSMPVRRRPFRASYKRRS